MSKSYCKKILTIAAAAVLIALFSLSSVFAGGGPEYTKCENCHSETEILYADDYQTTGTRYYHCQNCGYEATIHEHDLKGERVTVEPSCLYGGSEIIYCSICGEVAMGTPTSPALGHDYQKAGGFLNVTYVCSRCGDSYTKFNVLPIVLAVVVVVVGAAFVLAKKKKGDKPAENGALAAAAVSAASAAELPELSRKAVLYAAGEGEFQEYIKTKRYIKLILPEEKEEGEEGEDPILAAVKAEEPDLMILRVKDGESLDYLNKMLEADEKEELPDAAILADTADPAILEALAKLKDDEKIADFMSLEENFGKILTSFVLPLYKPELTLEGGLESAGKLAEKLGIPFVAEAVALIQTGSDVKEALEKEPGVSSGANLLSVIANIMGWESAAAAADTMLKACDVKDLAEEEKARQEEGEN